MIWTPKVSLTQISTAGAFAPIAFKDALGENGSDAPALIMQARTTGRGSSVTFGAAAAFLLLEGFFLIGFLGMAGGFQVCRCNRSGKINRLAPLRTFFRKSRIVPVRTELLARVRKILAKNRERL